MALGSSECHSECHFPPAAAGAKIARGGSFYAALSHLGIPVRGETEGLAIDRHLPRGAFAVSYCSGFLRRTIAWAGTVPDR